MVEILHNSLPPDLQPDRPLPGVQPLAADGWLSVDEAYAAQMAYRRKLLRSKREEVLWFMPEASDAVSELFHTALSLMPALGFGISTRHIFCPDGAEVDRDADHGLAVLGASFQQDLCIMQKLGDEHVLTAAVLCFPASWRLSEKAGRPLTAIHNPVDSYDAALAKRVQRLFDGVQPGRPLRRNNFLYYADPDLFQPRSEVGAVRERPEPGIGYIRAERQCIVRLPKTAAVVFSIHSFVVRQNG
ncbi:MAG: DUF3445 domain-containing protein [Pseudomonadota bacterium]